MFTQKEIRKMPRKNLSADQFIKLAGVKQEWIKEKIKHFENGTFLAIWRKTLKNKWYRLHLKTIWMKYYQLPYRTIKTADGKARVGKEMIISNHPLPKGAVINHK